MVMGNQGMADDGADKELGLCLEELGGAGEVGWSMGSKSRRELWWGQHGGREGAREVTVKMETARYYWN